MLYDIMISQSQSLSYVKTQLKTREQLEEVTYEVREWEPEVIVI